jgi:hypothetical protein
VPKIAHGMPAYGMLHKVPFFTSLDVRSKIMICSKMTIVTYQPYDFRSDDAEKARCFITTEGRPCSDMFIVLEGKVAVVENHRPSGYLDKHHFFGELCLLQPQELSSIGRMAKRTHYAVHAPARLAVLGYEDFHELRRARREINDTVLPYIKEIMSHPDTHVQDWFFVEICSARGITAIHQHYDKLAPDGQSDSYCCLYTIDSPASSSPHHRHRHRHRHRLLHSSDADEIEEEEEQEETLVGSTHIEEHTVNPTWNRVIMIKRDEVERSGGDMVLRFEVYHHKLVGDPVLLGQVTTSLCELCGQTVGSFCEWGPDAPDEVRELTLMSRNADGTDASDPTKGALQVSITNKDPYNDRNHIHTAEVKADVHRRRAAQHRRHIHLTDELADLAEVKERQVTKALCCFSALLLLFVPFLSVT